MFLARLITGKNTIVKAMIQKLSKDMPVPEDWCYVYNFTDPDRPRLINLSAGWGRAFQRIWTGLLNS